MQGIAFIFYLAVLIMSVVIHEISHGYAAYLLGDPTAKYADRLTLNPLKHLDFVGSILVPFLLYISHAGFMFGWAKPVPYNPYNLKNQKWGPAVVGLAGPFSNLCLALVFGLVIRFGGFLFFLPASFFEIALMIVVVNVALAVFNLVPIPPLDGSKLLYALLPYHLQRDFGAVLEQYGFIILLFFIMFFSGAIYPVVAFLVRLFTGVMM